LPQSGSPLPQPIRLYDRFERRKPSGALIARNVLPCLSAKVDHTELMQWRLIDPEEGEPGPAPIGNHANVLVAELLQTMRLYVFAIRNLSYQQACPLLGYVSRTHDW
jgi:hypothetical protein